MTSLLPDLDKTISGIAALRTVSKNPFSRFGYVADDPKTAGWRLTQRAPVEVQFAPKFRLNAADAVFTMGSCFARNVEESLIKMGVRVLLADFDFPLKYFDKNHSKFESWINSSNRGRIIRSILNKYTPLSMLNEFERILIPENFHDPNKGLIEISPTHWTDPHIKNVRTSSLEDGLAVRGIVEEASGRIRQATAIFLTLGLTETWLDSETGLVLNIAPPPVLLKKWPERFRFFNTTHQQVLQALERLYEILTTRVRPDMKFVVTVSPVPLGATFTDMDVISANAYSKATLRSAAHEFCARHETTDYFPSYEMALATHPDLAWEEDKVHVTQDVVDFIIERFVKGFFEPAGLKIAAA